MKYFIYMLFTALTLSFTACGNSDGTVPLDEIEGTQPSVTLSSIQIDQTDISVAQGTTGYITATAIYSDDTTKDITNQSTWTSSDVKVVVVDKTGAAEAVGVGSSVITVNFEGKTDTGNITVTSATLDSITVTPAVTSTAKGVDITYTATGIFSDKTSQDLTKEVSWTSSDTSVAKMDANIARTIASGTAEIKATHGATFATASLTVTAATLSSIQIDQADSTVPKGTTGYVTATAIYSDGTSEDITNQSTWASSDVKVVVVDKTGAAEAVGVGSSVITVNFEGKTDTGNITVTSATLQSIIIQSSQPELIVGTESSMSAVGFYSDGTNHDITKTVNWISSDSNTIKMNTWLAKGIAVGTATITASDNSGIKGSLDLVVKQAQVTSLKIVNSESNAFTSDDFVVGETIQAKALADFDNGVKNMDVTTKVTWIADKTGTVSVDKNGLITALKVGIASVDVSYQGEFGQGNDKVTGNVVAKTMTKIEIFSAPSNATVNAGESIKMEAWATYNDGSNLNISDTVNWTSDNINVRIINNGKNVLVTSDDRVEATIKAMKDKLEDNQSVVFERKAFDHIEIQDGYSEDGSNTIITGQTIDIPIVDRVDYEDKPEGVYYPTAWAVYTDGTKTYIGSSLGIRWWSANQIKAYVNTIKGSFVFGRGLGNGIEISISYRGEHKTSFFVNVKQDTTTKTLKQIGIVNTKLDGWGCSQNDNYYGESLEMNIGEEGKYLQACGKFEYTTGDILWEDINNNVAWSSENNDIARVQTVTGNVKALGGGTTKIHAILAGINGEIGVTVADKIPDHIEIQGYSPADSTDTKVITGQTLSIPIVDNVNYDPVTIGAYYPKAYLVFTDGTKEYINSTSGIRWWSSNQISAFVDTTRGSFVFGRGNGNGIEISVSYRGDNKTSFFVNVAQSTTTKTLTKVGIKNTKDLGWGCTQSDTDYGTSLTVKVDDNGKYLQACGKFTYTDRTTAVWEDINDNVAWFSSKEDVARVRTTTGELISKSAGKTTIKAQVAGIDGNTTVTVTP